MAINIVIDDATIQKLADEAVQRAVKSTVEGSAGIRQAIEKAISSVKIDTKQIEAAITASIKNVTDDPSFLDDLIRKAVLNGASKLGGSFDSSLRAAGKRLALDGDTIELVAENIKSKIEQDAEERKAELELKGGGAFS